MKITLEHVRSFPRLQEVPLRPLTFLVGENSSGKTTFLAIVSSILDALRFPLNPGFNEPPYSLGTFDTIATYKGGSYGRDDEFSIGFTTDDEKASEYRRVRATYGSEYGNIALRRLDAVCDVGRLTLALKDSTLSGEITLATQTGNGHKPLRFKTKMREPIRTGQPLTSLEMRIVHSLLDEVRTEGFSKQKSWRKHFDALIQVSNSAEPPYGSCLSVAPIRSKPRRTYDEFAEEYSPEGDHIPTLLARLLKQEPESRDARNVRSALQRFGTESGLFREIAVKRLGKKPSDPFQIQVRASGPPVNLADVGYGVSQALPIVVQSVLKGKSRVMLMQQPEVHLHPRAQAALGTFFSELVKEDNRIFVIETHSDYLVDRVRQEVAAGTISKDKVAILFFHKPNLETEVSEIGIDSNGNIVKAPPQYRAFFLQEEINLFARSMR